MRAPAPPSVVPAPHGRSVVQARRVSKSFGDVVALDGITLTIRAGEFVCLVGASGCGKTTLLNLLAALDRPTSGDLRVAGASALMFQEAALFPWLTAAQNIELALRLRKTPRAQRARVTEQLLQLVHLEGFGGRRPHELSGGMRQRVALGRALAQEADVLLMDEPFGALDAISRDQLHDELERVWQQMGLSIVFVTHNVREACRLGDRVMVLSNRPGRVVASYDVDVPRPRRIESPEVASLAGVVLARLRKEVGADATD